MMLTHTAIWRGIDLLAERNRWSASGLAKRAGLDPTTFNKSKRTTKQGKSRWPSTESVSKILEATGTSMAEFVALIDEGSDGRPPPMRRLRCLSLGQMEREQAIDAAGFPQAGPWEDVEFPSIGDDSAYAVELDRDLLAPILRAGDMLIVSPRSSVRRHDRVVLRLKSGRGRRWRADAEDGAAGRAGPFLPTGGGARRSTPCRWPGSLASCGSANRKMAAGKPAATSTGRHHNVREDEPGIAAAISEPERPQPSVVRLDDQLSFRPLTSSERPFRVSSNMCSRQIGPALAMLECGLSAISAAFRLATRYAPERGLPV